MRSLLLGPIVDRLGEPWTMRVGTVLLVLGLVLYPAPRSLWTLALIIPLVPIGTALLFPSTTSLLSRHSDPRELGATMGTAQTFAGLARVVAPLLATMAFQRLGHAWPFYLAGACVAVVGVLALQVSAEPKAPTAAEAPAGLGGG
jgi:MFS family permease